MNKSDDPDIFDKYESDQLLLVKTKKIRQAIVTYNFCLLLFIITVIIIMFKNGIMQYGIQDVGLRFLMLLTLAFGLFKFIKLKRLGWIGLVIIDILASGFFIYCMITFLVVHNFDDLANVVALGWMVLLMLWSIITLYHLGTKNIRHLLKIAIQNEHIS